MSGARGIRATSRAGGFGRRTWSRRWMADLESAAGRWEVGHARVDARNGHVLSVDITPRHARFRVRGSQPAPFEVAFQFDPLDEVDQQMLTELVARSEGGVSRILSGEFTDETGFLLLPAVDGETRWKCSCPVTEGICRHVLACGALLVEELDREPSLLLRLRGLSPRSLGAVIPGGAEGDEQIAHDLWGSGWRLPEVPTPELSELLELLERPVARRLAAAVSTDPVEQLRALSDLEDVLHALVSDLEDDWRGG